MSIKITKEIGNLLIELEFNRFKSFRYNHLGKSHPLHTSCLVIVNGNPLSKGTVIKHEYDTDDWMYGYRAAAKVAITKSITKRTIRTALWRAINEELENKKYNE